MRRGPWPGTRGARGRTPRRCGGRRRAWLGWALILLAPEALAGPAGSQGSQDTLRGPEGGPRGPTATGPGDEPAAASGQIPDPEAALGDEPEDPNDAPYMLGPRGGYPNWSADQPTGRDPRYGTRKRVQLTLAPTYAVFRWPFIGRGNGRLRGGGGLAAVDVQLVRWLWLRALAGLSWHPVEDLGEVEDDGSLTPIARAGLIRATHAGLGLVYPLDLGRWQPLVEGGAGLLWLSTPDAVQDGQAGGSCRSEGLACEPGLRCGADDLCQPVPVPLVHAGIGVDYLLGEHWAVGLAVRYHALLSNPADFPVYYTGSVRISARF